MAEDMDSADTQVGDVDSSLNASLPEPSKESSRETTPESVPTNDQSDRPKPKKRLTLQERLAQAAKGKKKPSSTTPTSLSRTTSNEDQKPDLDLQMEIERLKLENSALTKKLNHKSNFDKERNDLIAKLASKDDTIEQLRKEGEALSLKELKLNESIKKLKLANQDLEENIRDYSVKSEESSMKLEELTDFLKTHKFKTIDHVVSKYEEVVKELEVTKAGLENSHTWETKYNELVVSHEEANAAKKELLKETNEVKIELNMLKRQHKLEIESKNATIKELKSQMSASKQSFAQEISRLEDKIETLRLENESNETVSENVNEDGKVDFDEFSKLSEAHRILQKQYLSSQENWKAIESNLSLKVDNLSSSVESLKKSKHKLTQDLAKVNNSMHLQLKEMEKLEQDKIKLQEEKNQLQLTVEMKENEIVEITEKFEKFKGIYNQERAALNSKIQSLNDKIKEEKRPERLNLIRDNSVSSGFSWDNEIKLGESSTTPAINRDFSTFLDRNISLSSFTEIGDDIDDREQYSFTGQLAPPVGGGVPASSHSNNIQLVNKMSSNIRRLEIELNTLKDEYSKISTEKEKVEQELLESLKLTDEIKLLHSELDSLKSVIKDKEIQEQRMLELIGEKSEQVEELKADVVDLKELCKLQVQQLVEQSSRV